MKLSIVIPAYNEEKLIGRCLASINAAVDVCKARQYLHEIIVVDNNSTDGTADFVRQVGAKVVFEPINQISRARNTGGKAAGGDWLLFVDADSVLSPASLADLLEAVHSGTCAGGGCVVGFVDSPLAGRVAAVFWNRISRALRWAAGSFVFCKADAFRDIGGFSLDVYAGEEVFFSSALKRWARERKLETTILTKSAHLSSPRKLHLYSPWELISLLTRIVFLPFRTLKNKKNLDFYYDGRR